MDREIMMLAAKVVEADPKILAEAIEEICKAKKTMNDIGCGTYFTPDSICGAGGFLEKIGVKLGLTKQNRDPAEYWTVAPGVRLTRYRATDASRLIAVRKGQDGSKDVIFEISISAKTKKATIKRDDTVLFTVGTDGLSVGRVQTAAISVLRSYLRENNRAHRRRKERINRLVAERKAAAERGARK